jgi:hypothetical protein
VTSAVERAVAACEQSDAELCEIVGFDELPRERQAAIIHERHARAAIASLREPSDAVVSALWLHLPRGSDVPNAWRKAIDAALSEPGSGEGGE